MCGARARQGAENCSAQGLGHLVIRTCRASDFGALHFDTRQFSHLNGTSRPIFTSRSPITFVRPSATFDAADTTFPPRGLAESYGESGRGVSILPRNANGAPGRAWSGRASIDRAAT